MKTKVVVLGAGFGGLELSSILSTEMGDDLDLTLIDKNDSFFFGFSKFDVMFGRKTAEAVRIQYRNIVKPGVTFKQETVTAIDPVAKRVTTDRSTYFIAPSASPMTRTSSHRKSTRPATFPRSSRMTTCSSGMGRAHR